MIDGKIDKPVIRVSGEQPHADLVTDTDTLFALNDPSVDRGSQYACENSR